MKPSPEYLTALDRANAASRAFSLVQIAYRTRKIGDSEYLAARKTHDEAQRVFDEAFAKEENRES